MDTLSTYPEITAGMEAERLNRLKKKKKMTEPPTYFCYPALLPPYSCGPLVADSLPGPLVNPQSLPTAGHTLSSYKLLWPFAPKSTPGSVSLRVLFTCYFL